MPIRARATRLSALLLLLPLAACQAANSGTAVPSAVALRAAEAPRPASAQRLDEDGYPLLGAYPNAAANQLSDQAVTGQRARLQAASARQNRAAPAGNYQQSIRQLEALRREQQARAPSPASASAAPSPRTPEEVLREIEGQ